jgi:hypothetical protein
MQRSAVLPFQDRCSRSQDARKQTDSRADFVGLDCREGAVLGRNQYVELEVKEAKANGTAAS